MLTCLKCNITVTDARLKISNHVKNLRLQFFPQIITIMIFTISSPATATQVVHISADTVKSIFHVSDSARNKRTTTLIFVSWQPAAEVKSAVFGFFCISRKSRHENESIEVYFSLIKPLLNIWNILFSVKEQVYEDQNYSVFLPCWDFFFILRDCY